MYQINDLQLLLAACEELLLNELPQSLDDAKNDRIPIRRVCLADLKQLVSEIKERVRV